MLPPPPTSTLFPYTTLFRSAFLLQRHDCRGAVEEIGLHPPGAALVENLDRDLGGVGARVADPDAGIDRKSTRLNSSHVSISYAVFCLKKKIIREDSLNQRII